jgi:gliding motility-associated-like protein
MIWRIAFFIFISLPVHGQYIYGIINQYTPVTAIVVANCTTTITVQDTTGFNVGQDALIIQMKGASIDSTSNTSAFGAITNYNSAGLYEIFKIAAKGANTIVLNGVLTNTYNPNGRLQLVTFPTFSNVTIFDTVRCGPWNGIIGGVLAFQVQHVLTLDKNIDVSGKGFRGGNISNNPDGSCGDTSVSYFYDLYQTGSSWNEGGAMKGEGIAEISNSILAGRGRLANGAGGGNKHNTGGGGGGNYTLGGKGGDELEYCPTAGTGGLGGAALDYAGMNYMRLFLGGGGGCGDYNNAVGSDGTNGGGIIIIKADSLIGNNNSILANGSDNLILTTGITDGAGGGGAGGTILLDIQHYVGNCNIKANGGHGGDQGPSNYWGCGGPGGGGGTGLILCSTSILPNNVSTQLQSGTSGMIQNSAFTCFGTSYGATDGASSPIQYKPNVNILFSSNTDLQTSLGPDSTLCKTNSFVLNPTGTYNNYLWQNGSSDSVFTITNFGKYYVTVSNNNGCIASDTINIILDSLQINLGNDTMFCIDNPFSISPGAGFASYLWQDASVASSYSITKSGKYFVSVTNAKGCNASDTININNFNQFSFSLGNDTTICSDASIKLTAPVVNNAQYLWQDNSTNSSILASNAGLYSVRLEMDNCFSADTIFINKKDCDCSFFMPNAFSPNLDDNNETIKPLFGSSIELLSFKIFNRFGEMVFETNNPLLEWNGFYKGQYCDVGIYFYVLDYRCTVINKNLTQKGDIILLR